MATIEVNSTSIRFNEADYLNLKSLLPKLQKEFPFEKYNIKKLKVNGHNINPEGESPALIRPIDQDDRIEIDFTPITNEVTSFEFELSNLIDQILKKIDTCTDLLKDNIEDISQIQLSKIIEAIDIFIQGSNHCIKKLDLTDELPHKDLQIHLLSVLKAIFNAQSKKDFIVLTDLLEYELKDNLTQWKILIIPVIKKSQA